MKKYNRKRSSEPGGILIKGRHEVHETLLGKQRLEQIWLQESARGTPIDAIKKLATEAKIPCMILESRQFRDKFGSDSQGVVGLLLTFPYTPIDELLAKCGQQSVVVALNGVEDPRNLGAIVRTVEASGAVGVIIPKHRSASMTEWAIRTAQGAAAHLPISQVTNLGNTLESMKKQGFWVIGLDGSGEKSHTETMYPDRLVLVAGGENVALGKRVAGICDELTRIPLRGRTSSLNVSVSTAVVLFEVFRQRGLNNIKMQKNG